MPDLKTILKNHHMPRDVLGPGKRIDKDLLRSQLEKRNHHLTLMFWLAAIMTTVVFLLGIGIVVYHVDAPAAAATSFGAMGVTVGGAITIMRSLIKELGQVTLLVTLCGELDAERLAEVVNALLRKL